MASLISNSIVASARLAVCQGGGPIPPCDQLQVLPGNILRCKDCGCFLKLKAWISVTSCPRAKWPGDKQPSSASPAPDSNQP